MGLTSTVLIVLSSLLQQSANNPERITVRITAERIEVATSETEAQRFRDEGTAGGGILVVCRRMHITLTPTGSTLKCDDCTFMTAAGVEGTAEHAAFDLERQRAVFTGTDDTPVRLIVDTSSDADASRLTAARVTLNLTPSKQCPSIATPLSAVGGYETLPPRLPGPSAPGERIAPAPAR